MPSRCFVLPMAESLGWSLTLLNGAATGGLLVTGLCAYPVGALIDRHGGRYIMAAGSFCAAVLLALWSTIADPYVFYAIWLGLGACMAAILYEPVFVVFDPAFWPRRTARDHGAHSDRWVRGDGLHSFDRDADRYPIVARGVAHTRCVQSRDLRSRPLVDHSGKTKRSSTS